MGVRGVVTVTRVLWAGVVVLSLLAGGAIVLMMLLEKLMLVVMLLVLELLLEEEAVEQMVVSMVFWTGGTSFARLVEQRPCVLVDCFLMTIWCIREKCIHVVVGPLSAVTGA